MANTAEVTRKACSPSAPANCYIPSALQPSQRHDSETLRSDADASSLTLVARFHVAFNQSIHDEPHVSDAGTNALRVRLIQEELDELKEALAEGDPVGALDALTDLQYVLDGSFLSLGLHRWKDAAVAEVHRSNMSKLDAAGQPIMRADGKILKSENYTRPDLESVMAVADADFGVSGPTRSATAQGCNDRLQRRAPAQPSVNTNL